MVILCENDSKGIDAAGKDDKIGMKTVENSKRILKIVKNSKKDKTPGSME